MGDDTTGAPTTPQRLERLNPSPSSAGVARRAVRRALEEWGHDELTETAELLVSEVVTNAVLHAGTEIVVLATPAASGVRIEIHDGSPLVPALRHYGDEAATGRGLSLLEALASAWGIESVATGKVVWFELGTVGPTVDGAHEAAPDSQENPTSVVQLLALPAALVHATLQYGDAVLRELVLLSVAGELGGDVPAVYSTPEVDVSQILAAVEEAMADDRVAVDVEVSLPLSQAEPALERLALVNEADRLAREGRLLTAPAVPEIGACGRWLMSQIALQLRGEGVAAWELPPIVDTDAQWRPLSAEEKRSLAPPGVATMVADTANRIVFTSEEAARMLGWEADELCGRRLTTIIPPDLREAHLAGFTRLQVTGESRLLGRSVQVRAMRRDGCEVDVELRIDIVRRPQGDEGFRAVLSVVNPPPCNSRSSQ